MTPAGTDPIDSNAATPGVRIMLGLCAAIAVGNVANSASPFLLGSAIDGLGITEAMGGMLLTMELVAFALASLVVAGRVSSQSKRTWLLGSAVGLLASSLVAASADTYFVLALGRILAGGCAGALVSTANALIAGTHEPNRLFAHAMATSILVSAATLSVISYLSVPYAHHGANGMLVIVGVILFPLLLWIRDQAAASEQVRDDGSSIGVREVAFLASLFLISMSDSLIYSFSERIGLALDIEPHALSKGMGLMFLPALPGALTAAVLDTRLGRKLPICVGIVSTAACGLMIVMASQSTTYFVGMALKNFTLFMTAPYLLGTAAVLDRRGRVAAAAAGIYLLGGGFGPALAGFLVVDGNYHPLGLASVVIAGLALLLMVPVLISVKDGVEAQAE